MKRAVGISVGFVFAVVLALGVLFLFGLRAWSEMDPYVPRVPAERVIDVGALEPTRPRSLSEPRRPSRYAGGSDFTREVFGPGWWFDEGPGLIWKDRERLCWSLTDLSPKSELRFELNFDELMDLGQASEVMIAQVSKSEGDREDYALAFDREGRELWRHPAEENVTSKLASPLWGADGLYGVVLWSDGFTAYDLSGEKLWSKSGHSPTCSLLTHPELPGLFVELHLRASWYEHSESGAISCASLRWGWGRAAAAYRKSNPRESRFHPYEGALFPDRDGRPRLLLVGAGAHFSDVIVCEDREGKELWRMQNLSSVEGEQPDTFSVRGFAQVGKLDGLTCFALALDNGEVLLIDELGALLSRRKPFTSDEGESFHVRHFRGGTLGDGSQVLSIDSGDRDFLFELELDPLPVPQPSGLAK